MSVGCPTIVFPRGVFREWVSETCPLDPGYEYLRIFVKQKKRPFEFEEGMD